MLVFNREANENSLGVRAAPRISAPARKTSAFPSGQKMVPSVNVLPRSAATMSPVTAERMTNPMTSSITAAPKITRASLLCERLRSLNTRAVMPTLVAQSVAPMKMCR